MNLSSIVRLEVLPCYVSDEMDEKYKGQFAVTVLGAENSFR